MKKDGEHKRNEEEEGHLRREGNGVDEDGDDAV
jgi:hypothetical protein